MENFARIQHTLQASPERVFQALLVADALTTWFSEFADVAQEAKAYDFWGRYTPEAPATQQLGHHPLSVLTPNRHLHYTWQLNSVDTSVTFKLLPRQDETVLTLRHTAPEGSQLTSGWGLEDFWLLSLENLRRFLEGKSVTARMDFSKPMLGDIHHEVIVDAPAAKVFDVLIRPEQMDRWIANGASVEPELGGDYSFGWVGMKIVEIVPDKKLVVRSDDDSPDAVQTTVTWTLHESDGKTRLTFVHSGFAPDSNNSGMNVGWLSYMNFVTSIAEYGPRWQSPLALLKADFVAFYPASMGARQSQIVEELREPNDLLPSPPS